MSNPHLETRGGVHWYRRRIPHDLISAYGGKREFRRSLKTSDRKEAIRLARLQSVELDGEFERKRKERGPLQTPTELTDENIRRLCTLWQHAILEKDDENRMAGFFYPDYDDLGAHLAEVEPALRQILARGQLELFAPALRDFLVAWHIRVDEKAPQYRQLLYQFLQTVIQTVEVQRRRLNGEVVQTCEVAPLEAIYRADSPDDRFDSAKLYENWASSAGDRPLGTTSAFKTASEQFGAFMGGRPMHEVARKDLIAFRDYLLKSGVKPKTVETKVALIRAMFQVAVDAGIVEANPASRIKVPKPKVEPEARLPYGSTELLKIFSDPIYSGKLPEAAGGEAGCWLPALGLYTGARLEEMAQLLISDVVCDERHGWYVHVTDVVDESSKAGDTKRVKTVGSRRIIPLHPALIDAGFLRYVERLKRDGHHRLFPLLQKDVKKRYSGNWSKWWSRYSRKQMGIKSKLQVFHSLRHTFKEACREAGIPEEVHDALTGHRGGGVGRSYGNKQFPLGQLVKAIRRIRFPGVSLPVIEPMPQ